MQNKITKFFFQPIRDYLIIAIAALALIFDFIIPGHPTILIAIIVASIPTAYYAVKATMNWRISIETFNFIAILISFVSGELRSAIFILMMLASARILEWKTRSHANRAIEELLKLKPEKALREKGTTLEEIPAQMIKKDDIIVVKTGERVPVDGIITFGAALINEAPVTGESEPVKKTIGERILSGTLNESGVIKIRTTHVGKESTLEKMAELIAVAAKNKSRPERLADKFAAIFLPVVALGGLIIYIVTKNVSMTVAIFLVACADDMAVAIPMAMAAAIGRAAKRGVIIKGGEWLNSLASSQILVLDKTGTLTYGSRKVSDFHIEPEFSESDFWRLIASAEKFSEHPIGKTIFKEAAARFRQVADPDKFNIKEGAGLIAKCGKDKIIIGNEKIFNQVPETASKVAREKLLAERAEHLATVVTVFINDKFAGLITIADIPRVGAEKDLKALQKLGFKKIIMFTGDNAAVAEKISALLGITEWRAEMQPDDKLRELEKLEKSNGQIIMLGDGINDAPALARATVGIAMGGVGSAVAVEAADIIILTDNLARLPEIVKLSRQTRSVICGDMAIWAVSNIVGFTLVLTGIAGPAFAAFYNFITDFFPLLNSTRLFKKPSKK